MRFALINNEKCEAKHGLKGICPGCAQHVIAKCGTMRVHHWAHATKVCDNWWELETEWHRAWKNNFPAEWQEIFLPDQQTGEKHIADLRTAHGLVVEFQHSAIQPQERLSRENFYRNIVWVVDGTRLKRDKERFFKHKKEFRPTNKAGVLLVDHPEDCFPQTWAGSTAPVIFDFQFIDESTGEITDDELYCLFPTRIGRSALVVEMPRSFFIMGINNGEWLAWALEFTSALRKLSQERAVQEAALMRYYQSQTVVRHFPRPVYYRKKRRF